MPKLYYTPPSAQAFSELKEKAIEIWSTMGSEGSYRAEKIGRIRDIRNIQDNFMYMVAMFDYQNQIKLASMLSPETRLAVAERMIDGGQPINLIPF